MTDPITLYCNSSKTNKKVYSLYCIRCIKGQKRGENEEKLVNFDIYLDLVAIRWNWIVQYELIMLESIII